MKKVWTIASREYRSYFTSPIAYMLIAGFLFMVGFMFFFNLKNFHLESMQYQQYGREAMSITQGVTSRLFGNMNVILLFLTPLITMRLFAEEHKNQSIALLFTSPLTLTEIILGKFISAVLLLSTMIAPTLLYAVILFATGNPDPGPILTGYVGTLLMGSSFIAIGTICSSTTENQIVAAATTLTSSLMLWLLPWATYSAGGFWADVISYISLITHFNNLAFGVLSSTDIIYYLSFIGIALFITHRILDSLRWR